MRPAVLILNPGARRGHRRKRVDRIVAILRRGGLAIEVRETSGPGDATTLARSEAAAGTAAMFAYGGDGTLREVAAGLLGTGVPVGFLPAGTANVMARTLGLPGDPLRAATLLCRSRARELDVGLCGSEPFLMQASCGLDARVIARVRPRLKRRLGRPAVALAAIGEWLRYDYPEIQLVADGKPLSATFAAVCNIPYYGGAWRLVPRARPDDGCLDLLVFHGRSPLATLGFARDLFLGRRHLVRPDVEIRVVQEVEIRSPRDAPVQIDGDRHPDRPPLVIRLSPQKLRVLVP